jgi:hypothetical protein
MPAVGGADAPTAAIAVLNAKLGGVDKPRPNPARCEQNEAEKTAGQFVVAGCHAV